MTRNRRMISEAPAEVSTAELSRRVAELHRLARLQRGLRMGLRALWLGGVGAILAWGVNALWGLLPDPLTWLGAALLFALAPLVALVASLTPRAGWVWKLDRLLGLDEQVSTAWELVLGGEYSAREAGLGEAQSRKARTGNTRSRETHPGGTRLSEARAGIPQTGSTRLSGALMRDVLDLLPRVRQRMLERGWYIKTDLLAALIVLLLGGVLLGGSLLRPYSELLGDPPPSDALPLPPPPRPLQSQLQQQPAAPQADGAPGGDQQAPGGEQQNPSGEGESPENQPGQEQGGASMDRGAVAEALRELGENLSGQAGTFDLGQALENLDLNEAADALENLQDHLDELSPESRQRLAEALREAAEALRQAGEQTLPPKMLDAAEALLDQMEQGESPDLSQMAENLRRLADEMDPAEMAGSGAGAGQGQGGATGAPEPLNRLPGEGGDMDLPLGDAADSGLLNPSPPNAAGDGTASGSLDSSARSGEDAAQSPLLPNTFSWKWRDVVSQFFER